jgi:hypothetical protein
MATAMTTLTHPSLLATLKAQPSQPCTCAVGVCASWESLPEERWPAADITHLGTLRDPALDEPTFEQYHTMIDGLLTHYDSPNAPISALHFPYNRCDVFRCGVCERVLFKYTEYGGYFVDQRVRWARLENLTMAR